MRANPPDGRTVNFSLRLSPEEYSKLTRAAREAGLARASYLRMLLMTRSAAGPKALGEAVM